MNWSDDPRIAPHLAHFCDVVFFELQEDARKRGLPLPADRVPFTQIPLQAAGERFEEAVAECLGLILPAASGERLEEPQVFGSVVCCQQCGWRGDFTRVPRSAQPDLCPNPDCKGKPATLIISREIRS